MVGVRNLNATKQGKMTPSTSPPALWDALSLNDPHAQPDKANRVQQMFDSIAPTYELVNSVSSMGRDRVWRRTLIEMADVSKGAAVLDVACGTGNLVRMLADQTPAGRVVGVDFASGMLRHAVAPQRPNADYCQADACQLPFRDGRFDLLSCAFGVRNFQNLDAGLTEFARVLRAGGRALILEFSLPANRLLRKAYLYYFRNILPRTAGWISRDRVGAYRYLPESVISFLEDAEIVERLRGAGFRDVRVRRMTLGVVSIFVATKG
jgi:demethylmenaquinone methyltransferase/2-methoxy-6-polyprenyl-1,4-benzoquinol methylase